VAGIDFDGDGTINDLLPGTKWNQLNRGLDENDLRRLVEEYNGRSAGNRTPTGQVMPRVNLPANFQFADTFFSTDVRLGKLVRFDERYEINVFGEVFNVFNIANSLGTAQTCFRPRRSDNPLAEPHRCSIREDRGRFN